MLPRELLSFIGSRAESFICTRHALPRRSGRFPSLRRTHTSTSHDRELLVLGLESSADDSCAAIVAGHGERRRILSNIVIKQNAIHEGFGGIHPLHAQEAHQANLPLAVSRAFTEADVKLEELDGIAFTRGPGMYGCLSIAAGAAKALSAASGKPLLGIHHMQAHALTPGLTEESPPAFPFLTLLLSGGHTLLVLASSETSFKILATTTDESIGTSIDKVARSFELDWTSTSSGSPGAALEAFCAFPKDKSQTPLEKNESPFPIPFVRTMGFSLSGTRSHFTRIIEKTPISTLSKDERRSLARRFMVGAVAQLENKVKLALSRRLWESEGDERPLGALVISGGVASNRFIRDRLRFTLDSAGFPELPLIFPPVPLCTDNAAMIAHVGISRLQRGRTDGFGTTLIPKWSIEECEKDFEEPDAASTT